MALSPTLLARLFFKDWLHSFLYTDSNDTVAEQTVDPSPLYPLWPFELWQQMNSHRFYRGELIAAAAPSSCGVSGMSPPSCVLTSLPSHPPSIICALWSSTFNILSIISAKWWAIQAETLHSGTGAHQKGFKLWPLGLVPYVVISFSHLSCLTLQKDGIDSSLAHFLLPELERGSIFAVFHLRSRPIWHIDMTDALNSTIKMMKNGSHPSRWHKMEYAGTYFQLQIYPLILQSY